MRIVLLFLTLLYLLFGVSPVLAVTVTISDVPASITDQPFSFNVAIAGANAGTNYLRANFSQPGATNYFGYTYNGSSYINSSTCTDYLPITIDSTGNWSGTVQAKLDSSSSYYSGSGNYSFKVRRYTQSCSSSSYIWSNEVTTAVSIPTSTPTPTPTSSPNSTPSSTPTISSFTISNVPSQINSTQAFNATVNLSLLDKPNTNFYLKGAFKHPDKPNNYFGLTKVSGDWIKNSSSFSNQYPIKTDQSGNWSGSIETKVDTEDSGFIGTGDYIFKVAKYEESTLAWSNDVSIKIIGEVISDTSDTSSETSKPSPTPTSSPKTLVTKTTNTTTKLTSKTASVAGISKIATPSIITASSSAQNIKVESKRQNNIFVYVGVALIILGMSSAIYLIYKKRHATI